MAQLIKERSRSPVIDFAHVFATNKTVDGELHYAIEISESWKEGGKHARYGLILSKPEAMNLMGEWLKAMAQQEVAEQRSREKSA